MKSKLANVVGGKSARACDNCVRKRARWYCAADDAFLCQSCDSSVHSANPLARRHERVRLKTSSSTPPSDILVKPNKQSSSSWHNGFTKKPRTPRQKKHAKVLLNHPLRLVPEISSEENNINNNNSNSNEDNDEQLLYRVPIFDPFHSEFSNPNRYDESKANQVLQNFLPSEMDLAEFAADVESLLGTGLEDETFDMESLGLLDSERVKSEQEELLQLNHQHEVELIDIGKETFELNFDYDCGEEEAAEQPIMMMINDLGSCNKVDHHHEESKKNTLLRLNYQAVLSAWDEHKSPWTNGERPELDDSADCWPSCMGTCGRIHVYGEIGQMITGHVADGGREARVSRYREKRRTRLFSKKIRYEVRKLNAEKRPRMKGRFVKRANLVASGLPLLTT